MMVPFHEEHAGGATVGVHDRYGELANSAAERVLSRREQNPAGASSYSAPVDVDIVDSSFKKALAVKRRFL